PAEFSGLSHTTNEIWDNLIALGYIDDEGNLIASKIDAPIVVDDFISLDFESPLFVSSQFDGLGTMSGTDIYNELKLMGVLDSSGQLTSVFNASTFSMSNSFSSYTEDVKNILDFRLSSDSLKDLAESVSQTGADLFTSLFNEGYIDSEGHITDRVDPLGSMILPPPFSELASNVHDILVATAKPSTDNILASLLLSNILDDNQFIQSGLSGTDLSTAISASLYGTQYEGYASALYDLLNSKNTNNPLLDFDATYQIIITNSDGILQEERNAILDILRAHLPLTNSEGIPVAPSTSNPEEEYSDDSTPSMPANESLEDDYVRFASHVLNGDRLYDYINTTRRLINRFTLLFHMANSLAEYHLKEAHEILDSSVSAGAKQELSRSRNDAQKVRKKIASSINKWQQKVGSSVQEISGEITSLVQNKNRANYEQAKLDVELFANQNLLEGMASGIVDGMTHSFSFVRSRVRNQVNGIFGHVMTANTNEMADMMEHYLDGSDATYQSGINQGRRIDAGISLWGDISSDDPEYDEITNSKNQYTGAYFGKNIWDLIEGDGETGTSPTEKLNIRLLIADLKNDTTRLEALIDRGLGRGPQDINIYGMAQGLSENNVNLLSGQNADVTETLPTTFFTASRDQEYGYNNSTFVDIKLSKLEEFRNYMTIFENMLRKALILKQTIMDKKQEEAEKIGGTEGTSSSKAIASATEQALDMEIGKLTGSFDQMYSQFLEMHSSVTDFTKAQIQYYKDYRYLIAKNAKNAAHIATLAGATASGAALASAFAVTGSHLALPTYWSFAINQLGSSIIESSYATWEYYDLEVNTPEWNRPVIMQEGSASGTNHYSHLWTQRYINQADDISEGLAADPDNLFAFTDTEQAYYESKFTSQLMSARNTINKLHSDGDAYGDFTLNYGIGETNNSEIVKGTPEFATNRGDGAITIEATKLATKNPELTAHFNVLRAFMSILKSYYDAIEGVWSAMFNIQKSGSMHKYGSQFEAILQQEQGIIESLKHEISIFQQASMQNFDKDKSIYTKFYDSLMTQLDIPASLLAFLPPGGRDAAILAKETATESLRMTILENFGDYAGQWSNYKRTEGAFSYDPNKFTGLYSDELFADKLEQDKLRSDSNYQMYTVDDENPNPFSIQRDPVTGEQIDQSALTVGQNTLRQEGIPYWEASQAETLRDAYQIAPWHKIEYEERGTLQKLLTQGTRRSNSEDVLLFREINYAQVIDTQQELLRTATIRSMLLMIEKTLYNAKLTTLRKSYGAASSAGVIDALMSVSDNYSQAQSQEMGDLLQEMGNRVEAHTIWYSSVINTSVAATGLLAFLGIALAQANANAGDTNSMRKFFRDSQKSAQRSFAKGVATSVSRLIIGVFGLATLKPAPQTSSQMMAYDEKEEEETVDLTKRKEELEKEKAENGGTLSPEKQAELDQTNERLGQLAENKAERGTINIDQGSLQFTGRGRLSINRGVLTRIQTKFKQKLRGLKLRREMSLALSDAKLEASGEISGEQASGSHRGIMSVLNKFGSSEQGIMDSLFKGVSARATAFNRAMDEMKKGATSFITTSASKIIQNKIEKADKSVKLKNTQAQGTGNSPGSTSLTKAAQKAHRRKQLLEVILTLTDPVLYLLIDAILNSASEETFSLSSTEQEDITVSEEGAEFDDESNSDGFGGDDDGYSGFSTASLENESLRDSLIAGNVSVRRAELDADKETHQYFAQYFSKKFKDRFALKDSPSEKDSAAFGKLFGNRQFKKAKLDKFKSYTAGKFDPNLDANFSKFKRADDSIARLKFGIPAQNETAPEQAGRYALNAIKFLINIGLIPLAAIYRLPQIMMARQRKFSIREQGFDDNLSADEQTRKVMEGWATVYRRKDAQKHFNKGTTLTDFEEMGVDRRLDLMDAYSGFEDTEDKLKSDSDFKVLKADMKDQIQKELIALKSTTSFILGREDNNYEGIEEHLSLLFNTHMSTNDAEDLALQITSVIQETSKNSKFKSKFFGKKNNDILKESIDNHAILQNFLLEINDERHPNDRIDTKFILTQIHALAASNKGNDELIRRHESLSNLLLEAGLATGLIASLDPSFDTGSGSSGRDESDSFNESEKAFKAKQKEEERNAQLELIQDQLIRLTESRNFFESSNHHMMIDDKGGLKLEKPDKDTLKTFTPIKLAVTDPTTGLFTGQTVTLFIAQSVKLNISSDTNLLSDDSLKSKLNSQMGHFGDEFDFQLETELPEEIETNPRAHLDEKRRREIAQYSNDISRYDTQLFDLQPNVAIQKRLQNRRHVILDRLKDLPEIDAATQTTLEHTIEKNKTLIQRVRNEFGDNILPDLFPDVKGNRDPIKNPDGKGAIYHSLRKQKEDSYLGAHILTAEDELDIDQELNEILDGRPHKLSNKTTDFHIIQANLAEITDSFMDISGKPVNPLLVLERQRLSLELNKLEINNNPALENDYNRLRQRRGDTSAALDILLKEDADAKALPPHPEKYNPSVSLASIYQQRDAILIADESKTPQADPSRKEFLEHYLKHAGLGFNRLMAKKRSLDLIGTSVEATRTFKLDEKGKKVSVTPEEHAAYKLKADQLSQQLENFGGFSLSFGSKIEGMIKNSARSEKLTSDSVSDGYHAINSSLKEVLKKLTKGDITTTRDTDQFGGHHYLDEVTDMANDPEKYGIHVMSAKDARTHSFEGIESFTGLMGGSTLALLPAIASLAPRLLGLITSAFGIAPNKLSNGLHDAASSMVKTPFYYGTNLGDGARRARNIVLGETVGDAFQDKATRHSMQAERVGVNRQAAANSIIDSVSHAGREGASGKPSRVNRHRGHELAKQLNGAYKVDFRDNVDSEANYYLTIERAAASIIHRKSGTIEDMAEILLHLLDKISDPKRAAKIGAHIFQKATIENPDIAKKLTEALTETAKRTDEGKTSKKYLKLAATSLFEAGSYDERQLFGHLNKKLEIDGKSIHHSSDTPKKKRMRILGQTIGLPGLAAYSFAYRTHRGAVLKGLKMGESVSNFKHDHALKGIANLDGDTLQELAKELSGSDLRKGPLRHLLNDTNSMERIVKSIKSAGLPADEQSKRLNALAILYTKSGLKRSPHVPDTLKDEVTHLGSKTDTLLASFDEIGQGDIPGVSYSDFVQNGESLSQFIDTLRTDKYSEEFTPGIRLTSEEIRADIREKASHRRLNILGKEELKSHIETIADLLTTANSVDEVQSFLSLLDDSGTSGDEIIENLGRYLGNSSSKATKHLSLLLDQVESQKASRLNFLITDERNQLVSNTSLQRNREVFLKKEEHRFIESLQSLNELDDEHFETFLQDDRQLNAVTKAIGRGLAMQLDVAHQGLVKIASRLQTTPALRDRFAESLAKRIITVQETLKNGYEAMQLSTIKSRLEEKAKRMNNEKDFATFLNKLDYAYRIQQSIPSLDTFLGKTISTDEQVRTVDIHSSRYGIDATGSFLQKAATQDPTAVAFLFSDLNKVNPTLSNALLDSMTNHTTPDLSQTDLLSMQDFYTSVATNSLILLSHIPGGILSTKLRTKLGSKKINGEIPLDVDDVEDILNELEIKAREDYLSPEELTLLNQAQSFMRAKDAFGLTETIIRSIGQSSNYSPSTRTFSGESNSLLMSLLIDPTAFIETGGQLAPSKRIKDQAKQLKTTQLKTIREEIEKQIAVGRDRTASPRLRNIQQAKNERLSNIVKALTLLQDGTSNPATSLETNPVLFQKLIDAKIITKKPDGPPIKYEIAPDSEKSILKIIELHHADTIIAQLDDVYPLDGDTFAFEELPVDWQNTQLLNEFTRRGVFEMNVDGTYVFGPNSDNLENELESILDNQNNFHTHELLSNSPHFLLDQNGSVLEPGIRQAINQLAEFSALSSDTVPVENVNRTLLNVLSKTTSSQLTSFLTSTNGTKLMKQALTAPGNVSLKLEIIQHLDYLETLDTKSLVEKVYPFYFQKAQADYAERNDRPTPTLENPLSDAVLDELNTTLNTQIKETVDNLKKELPKLRAHTLAIIESSSTTTIANSAQNKVVQDISSKLKTSIKNDILDSQKERKSPTTSANLQALENYHRLIEIEIKNGTSLESLTSNSEDISFLKQEWIAALAPELPRNIRVLTEINKATSTKELLKIINSLPPSPSSEPTTELSMLITSVKKGAALLKTIDRLTAISETEDEEKKEMVSKLNVKNGAVVLNKPQLTELRDILLSGDEEETTLAITAYKKQHPKIYFQLITALSKELVVKPEPRMPTLNDSQDGIILADIHVEEHSPPPSPSISDITSEHSEDEDEVLSHNSRTYSPYQIELAVSESPLLNWFYENEYDDIMPILRNDDLFKATALSSTQLKRNSFPSDEQVEQSVSAFFHFGIASASSPNKKKFPEESQEILNNKISQLRTINYDFNAFSRLILQSSDSIHIESIENLKAIRQLLGAEDIQSGLMANLQTLIQKIEARKFGLYDEIQRLSQKVLKNTMKEQSYSAELKNIHGLLFAHADELRDIGIEASDIEKLGQTFINPQQQLLLTIQLLNLIENGDKEKQKGLKVGLSNEQLKKQVNQARQALSSAAIHELIVNPDTSFTPLADLIPDFLKSLKGLGTSSNNPFLNGLSNTLSDPETVDRLFTLYSHVTSNERDELISEAFVQAGIFKVENSHSLKTVMTYLSHDPVLTANIVKQAPLNAQSRLINQAVDVDAVNRTLPFAGQPSGLDKGIQLLGFISGDDSIWETLDFLPKNLSDNLDLISYIYVGLPTQVAKDSFRAHLASNLSKEDLFDVLENENSIESEAAVAVSLSPESTQKQSLKIKLIDVIENASDNPENLIKFIKDNLSPLESKTQLKNLFSEISKNRLEQMFNSLEVNDLSLLDSLRPMFPPESHFDDIFRAQNELSALINSLPPDIPSESLDSAKADKIIAHVLDQKDSPNFQFYLKALKSLDAGLKQACLNEMAIACSDPDNRDQSLPILESVLKTSGNSTLVKTVLETSLANYPESFNDTLNVLLRNPFIRPHVFSSFSQNITETLEKVIQGELISPALSAETVSLLLSKSKTNSFRTTVLPTSPTTLSKETESKLHAINLLKKTKQDETIYHSDIQSQSELQTQLTRSGKFSAAEIKGIILDWMKGINELETPILIEKLQEHPSLFQALSIEKSMEILSSFSTSGHLKTIRPYLLSQPTAVTNVVIEGFEENRGSDEWTASLSILNHLGQRPQTLLNIVSKSLSQIEETFDNPEQQEKIEAIIRDTIGSPSFLNHSKNKGRAIEKLIEQLGESGHLSAQSKQTISETFVSLANSTTSITGVPITKESLETLLTIDDNPHLLISIQNAIKNVVENDSLKQKLTNADFQDIEKKLQTDTILDHTQIDDVLQFLKLRAKRTGVRKETKIRLSQHLIRNGLGSSLPNRLAPSTILSTLAHTGDIPKDLSAYADVLNDPGSHFEIIEKLTKIGEKYPLMFDQLIQHKDLKHLLEKPLDPIKLQKASIVSKLNSTGIPHEVIVNTIDNWFEILEETSMMTRSSSIPPSYSLNTADEAILIQALYKAILNQEGIDTNGLTNDAIVDRLQGLGILDFAKKFFSRISKTDDLVNAAAQKNIQDFLNECIHKSTASMSEATAIQFIKQNLEPRPLFAELISTLNKLNTSTNSQERLKLKSTIHTFITHSPYSILGQAVSAIFGPFKALGIQKNPDSLALNQVITNSQPMIQRTIIEKRIKNQMVSIAAEWTLDRDASPNAPQLFDTNIVDANGKLNEKYLNSSGELLENELIQDIQLALSVNEGPSITDALDDLKQSYLIALLEHMAKNSHPAFESKDALNEYLTTVQDYEEGPDLDDLLTALEPLIVYAHLSTDLTNNADYLKTDADVEAALLSWGIADSTPQTQHLITYAREIFEVTHRLSHDVTVEHNYLSSTASLQGRIQSMLTTASAEELQHLENQMKPLQALQSLRSELTVSGTFTNTSKQTLIDVQNLREAAHGSENTELRESYDTLLETVSKKSASNLTSVMDEINKPEGSRDLLWLDDQLRIIYNSEKKRTELLIGLAYGQENLTASVPPLSWSSTETMAFLSHVKQGESRNRLEQLIGSGLISEATTEDTSIEESMAKQKIIDNLYLELVQETAIEPGLWLKRVESIASYLDEEKIDALLNTYTRNLTIESPKWTEKHETLITKIANSKFLESIEQNGKKGLRLSMLKSVMSVNNGKFNVSLLQTLQKHDNTKTPLFPQLMNHSLRTHRELYLTKNTEERQFLKKLIIADVERNIEAEVNEEVSKNKERIDTLVDIDDIEKKKGFLSNPSILNDDTQSILGDVFDTIMKSRKGLILRRRREDSFKNRFTELYSHSITNENKPLQRTLQQFIAHLTNSHHDLTWLFDEITSYTSTRSKNDTDNIVTFTGISKKDKSFWKKHLTKGESPLLSKTGEPLARINTTLNAESIISIANDINITIPHTEGARFIHYLSQMPNEFINEDSQLNISISDDLLLQKMTHALRSIGISTDTNKLQKMSQELVSHLKTMKNVENQFQLALAEEASKTFDLQIVDGMVINPPEATTDNILFEKNLGEIMGILKENGLIQNGQIMFPLPKSIEAIDWKNSDLNEQQKQWILDTLNKKHSKMKTALSSLNEFMPQVLYRYDESHMNGKHALMPYLYAKNESQVLSTEHMLYDVMKDRMKLTVLALSSAPKDYEKRQLITPEEATAIFETLKKSDVVDEDLLVIAGKVEWTHLHAILKTIKTTDPKPGETKTIKLTTKQIKEVQSDLDKLTEHALLVKDRLLNRPTTAHIEYLTNPNLSKEAKAFYIQMMTQKPVLQSKSLNEQDRKQSQVTGQVIEESLRQAISNQTEISSIKNEIKIATHATAKNNLETTLNKLKQKQTMLNETILNLYSEVRPQFQEITNTPEHEYTLEKLHLKMLVSRTKIIPNDENRLTNLGSEDIDVLHDGVSTARESLMKIAQLSNDSKPPEIKHLLDETNGSFLTIMLAANSLIKQGLAKPSLITKITSVYSVQPDLLTVNTGINSDETIALAFSLPESAASLKPLNERYTSYKDLQKSCIDHNFLTATHDFKFIHSLFYRNDSFDSDYLNSFVESLPLTSTGFEAGSSYNELMTDFTEDYPHLTYKIPEDDIDVSKPSTDISNHVEQTLINNGYLTKEKLPTAKWTDASDLTDIPEAIISAHDRADINTRLLSIYRHKHIEKIKLTLSILTDLGTVVEKNKTEKTPNQEWLCALSGLFQSGNTVFIQGHIDRLNLKERINDEIEARFGKNKRLTYFNETEIENRLKSIIHGRDPSLMEEQFNLERLNTLDVKDSISSARDQFSSDGNLLKFLQSMVDITATPPTSRSDAGSDIKWLDLSHSASHSYVESEKTH
ncbi:hypothetical protein HOG98_01325, partial [bacterium]|nr:hypothetical protein [bacterium]